MAKNFIEDIAFGAQGSTYADASSNAITPPAGQVYVAIQMLTDTTFDSANGLVSESATLSINTEGVGAGTNGKVVDSVIFTAGTTIYGRWTEIDITTGSVIAYVGN